jgi:hypothetical protein
MAFWLLGFTLFLDIAFFRRWLQNRLSPDENETADAAERGTY